jgi:dTDP-4-dehydrorhamnose reductase
MRILIFGAGGMLGHKLCQRLIKNHEVSATVRGGADKVANYGIFDGVSFVENVDVTDTAAVEHAVETARPEVVINAAGVIKQLPSASDVINTLSVNSIFPNLLAELAAKHNFRLICISTDCVFNGEKGGYTEEDKPDAYDLYGQSKRFGEVTGANCLTIRTSIIGRELGTSHSLVDWFLSNRGGSVKGFTKAIYSGFPTVVFADIIERLITEWKDLSGLFHVSSEPIDKYSLLRMINDAFDAEISIEPSDELAIDRSLDSKKFRELTGFVPKPWPEMISEMAADTTPYDKWKN